MFWDTLERLNLLERDPEAGVLCEFNLPARVVIVQTYTEELLQAISQASNGDAVNLECPAALTTDSQLRFALEICGEAFSFPLENLNVIAEALTLYEQFVALLARAPVHTVFAADYPNRQLYIETIMAHVSMIFRDRNAGQADPSLGAHSRECIRALQLYRTLADMETPVDTNERLLKIVLGCTESVLHPFTGTDDKRTANPTQIGTVLVDDFLFTLFYCWLRSYTQNDMLWVIFKEFFNYWTTNDKVIAYWCDVIHALTRLFVDDICNPNKAKTSLRLHAGAQEAYVDLDSEHIQHGWIRVFFLLKDINTVGSPRCFHAAMKGLQNCLNIFFEVISSGAPGAPDGNTLLNIFGGSLFGALFKLRSDYDEGTIVALECISQIFRKCANSPFEEHYFAALFACIRKCLSLPAERSVLSYTFYHTQDLMTLDFPGSRFLIPFYIRALERVINPNQERIRTSNLNEHVLLPFIKLMSSLIPTANRYGPAAFATDAPSGGLPNTLPPITTYASLEPHFGYLLSQALTIRQDSVNIISLLWLSFTFLREYLPSTARVANLQAPANGPLPAVQFIWIFVDLIIKQINTNSAWSAEVSRVAIDVLCDMVNMYEDIPEKEKFAHGVVSRITDYVRQNLNHSVRAAQTATFPGGNNQTVNRPSKEDEIIMSCFRCITNWIMCGSWVEDDHDIISSVFHVCLTAAPYENMSNSLPKLGVQTIEGLSPFVQEAGVSCLSTLINLWHVYPSIAGAERVSTTISEIDIINKIAETCGITPEKATEFSRYYALSDDTILTLIDLPFVMDKSDTLAFIMIIRDRSGKYAWEGHIKYNSRQWLENPPAKIPIGPAEQCLQPHYSQVFENSRMSDDYFQDVYTFDSQLKINVLEKVVDTQCQAENEILSRVGYQLGTDVQVYPVGKIPYSERLKDTNQTKFIASRLFLSSMNLITPQRETELIPIEDSAKFQASLQEIDMCPERNIMSVGVLYQAPTQHTGDEIISNQRASPLFDEFVWSLGWKVNLATHRGFMADMNRTGAFGQYAPYYADHDNEVMFHVGPLMSGGDHQNKRRVLNNDYVLIVWSEDKNFDENTVVTTHCHMRIVISPQTSGLFHVRVIRDDKVDNTIGPIFSSGIVSRHALGHLVRLTAMNGVREIQKRLNIRENPLTVRKAQVQNVIGIHRRSLSPAKMYSSLLFQCCAPPPVKVPTGIAQVSAYVPAAAPPTMPGLSPANIPPPAMPVPASAPAPTVASSSSPDTKPTIPKAQSFVAARPPPGAVRSPTSSPGTKPPGAPNVIIGRQARNPFTPPPPAEGHIPPKVTPIHPKTVAPVAVQPKVAPAVGPAVGSLPPKVGPRPTMPTKIGPPGSAVRVGPPPGQRIPPPGGPRIPAGGPPPRITPVKTVDGVALPAPIRPPPPSGGEPHIPSLNDGYTQTPPRLAPSAGSSRRLPPASKWMTSSPSQAPPPPHSIAPQPPR